MGKRKTNSVFQRASPRTFRAMIPFPALQINSAKPLTLSQIPILVCPVTAVYTRPINPLFSNMEVWHTGGWAYLNETEKNDEFPMSTHYDGRLPVRRLRPHGQALLLLPLPAPSRRPKTRQPHRFH